MPKKATPSTPKATVPRPATLSADDETYFDSQSPGFIRSIMRQYHTFGSTLTVKQEAVLKRYRADEEGRGLPHAPTSTLCSLTDQQLRFIDHNSLWNEFAFGLLTYVVQHGAVTEAQYAALLNMMRKMRSRDVPTYTKRMDVNAVAVPLLNAQSAGVRSPKLHLHGYQFGLTTANSKFGAGRVAFCRDDKHGTRLGSFGDDGRVFPTIACRESDMINLRTMLTDPVGFAQRYAQIMQRCCCCQRELIDSKSLTMGAGPTCARDFDLGAGTPV